MLEAPSASEPGTVAISLALLALRAIGVVERAGAERETMTTSLRARLSAGQLSSGAFGDAWSRDSPASGIATVMALWALRATGAPDESAVARAESWLWGELAGLAPGSVRTTPGLAELALWTLVATGAPSAREPAVVHAVVADIIARCGMTESRWAGQVRNGRIEVRGADGAPVGVFVMPWVPEVTAVAAQLVACGEREGLSEEELGTLEAIRDWGIEELASADTSLMVETPWLLATYLSGALRAHHAVAHGCGAP